MAEETLDAWSYHLGEPSPHPGELRARIGAGTLPDAIARTARRVPHSPAVSVGERLVTHGELDALTRSFAFNLGRLGLKPGLRVLLVASPGIEEIAAYLGVLRLGATAVLAGPSLTATEFSQLQDAAAASWLVGSGASLATYAGAAPPGLEEIVGLRPEDKDVASSFIGEFDEGDLQATLAVDPHSAAILAFTSGTTGSPKATPLSHANLLSSVRSAMLAWRWSERDHLVHSLPISHQHGLSGIHATLLSGSRLTLIPRFDPGSTLDAVVGGGATVHFGVPTVYQRILERLGDRAHGLSVLRLATSGSAPLPVTVADRYHKVVGVRILERYGTTESGLNLSNPHDGPRVPGSVGTPLPGVEVAIADDSGEPSDPGETGEILVRGPQVFSGYEGVAVAAQPFLHGWFRTGDLGSVDLRTGYVRVVGRTKEVIITGGMNAYPREIEDALRGHPDVSDAVVVGVESSEWGEEVVAVVTPASVDTSRLAEFASERLAGYKRPKRIVAVASLPRSAVGKVDHERILRLIGPSASGLASDE